MTFYLLPCFKTYYNRIEPEGEDYWQVLEDLSTVPLKDYPQNILQQNCLCWLWFEICYSTAVWEASNEA